VPATGRRRSIDLTKIYRQPVVLCVAHHDLSTRSEHGGETQAGRWWEPWGALLHGMCARKACSAWQKWGAKPVVQQRDMMQIVRGLVIWSSLRSVKCERCTRARSRIVGEASCREDDVEGLGELQRLTVSRPPPYVGGVLGGASAPTAPPTALLRRGRDESPPTYGGVSTPPISLITPFLRDINPV